MTSPATPGNEKIHCEHNPETYCQFCLKSLESEVARLQNSMVKHFNEKHLEGDGPKIDRLEREVSDLLATQKSLEAVVEAAKIVWEMVDRGHSLKYLTDEPYTTFRRLEEALALLSRGKEGA